MGIPIETKKNNERVQSWLTEIGQPVSPKDSFSEVKPKAPKQRIPTHVVVTSSVPSEPRATPVLEVPGDTGSQTLAPTLSMSVPGDTGSQTPAPTLSTPVPKAGFFSRVAGWFRGEPEKAGSETQIQDRILTFQQDYVDNKYYTDEDAQLKAMEEVTFEELRNNSQNLEVIQVIQKQFTQTPEAQLQYLEVINNALSRYEKQLQIDHRKQLLTIEPRLRALQNEISSKIVQEQEKYHTELKIYPDILKFLNRLLNPAQKEPLSIQEIFTLIQLLDEFKKINGQLEKNDPKLPGDQEVKAILSSEPIANLIKLKLTFENLLKIKTKLNKDLLTKLKERYSEYSESFDKYHKKCANSMAETDFQLVKNIKEKQRLQLLLETLDTDVSKNEDLIASALKQIEIIERKIKILDTNYRIAVQALQKRYREYHRQVAPLREKIGAWSTWEKLKNFLFPAALESQLYQLELDHQLALNGFKGLVDSAGYLIERLKKTILQNKSLTNANDSRVIAATKNAIFKTLSTPFQKHGYANATVLLIYNLFDWANKHPLAAKRMAGSLQRISSAILGKNALSAGYQQGTTEAQIRDFFQGNRTYLSAAQETEPMPAELVFLLYAIEKAAPVVQVASSAVSSAVNDVLILDSLGGVFGAISTGSLVGALMGISGAVVSNAVSQAIVENRSLELTASAILDGVAYDGTFVDKVVASAEFIGQRELMVQTGNALTDGREQGTWQNLSSTVKHWWKESIFKEKITRLAAQGGPMVVAGAVIGVGLYTAASIATFGTLPAATAILLAVGAGVAAVASSVWGAIKVYSMGKLYCDTQYKESHRKVEDLVTQDRFRRNHGRILTQQKHLQLQAMLDTEQNEEIFNSLPNRQMKAQWLAQTTKQAANHASTTPYETALVQFNRELGFPPDWAEKEDESFWKIQAKQLEKEFKAKRKKPKALV